MTIRIFTKILSPSKNEPDYIALTSLHLELRVFKVQQSMKHDAAAQTPSELFWVLFVPL